MRTYRELFALPEFGAAFSVASLQAAASTVSGLALATLVYADTGSPLLSALSMFGASFAQVLGATMLLSISDRVPPRAALATLALIYAAGTALLAAPGLPVAAMLGVILVLGVMSSVGGGVQWGLITSIVPEQGYILGRSVFNMSIGVMQIIGFAVGAGLVSWLSPRGTLLVAAALYLVAAGTARLALTARAARSIGRPSVRQTWRVNRELWSMPARRYVYLSLWVPNGLIVGCEALFIPYAPHWAGLLFVAAAAGMLVGDTTMGRFVPNRLRGRLITPIRLLLAVPYLLFALHLDRPLATIAVALASIGYSASLLLQDRLIALTGDEIRGQALGLNSSGMMTMQAVGAALGGLLAEFVAPATAMTVLAAASLLVTLALTPGLNAPLPRRMVPAEPAPA